MTSQTRDLAAIIKAGRELEDKASKGPWRVVAGEEGGPEWIISSPDGFGDKKTNLEFCATARKRFTASLDCIEALEGLIDRFHKCMTVNGTDEEYADIACEPYRAKLAAYAEIADE